MRTSGFCRFWRYHNSVNKYNKKIKLNKVQKEEETPTACFATNMRGWHVKDCALSDFPHLPCTEYPHALVAKNEFIWTLSFVYLFLLFVSFIYLFIFSMKVFILKAVFVFWPLSTLLSNLNDLKVEQIWWKYKSSVKAFN